MNIFEIINFEADLIDIYYFCPHTFCHYSGMFSTDKKRLKFFFLLNVNIKLEIMSWLFLVTNVSTYFEIFFLILILVTMYLTEQQDVSFITTQKFKEKWRKFSIDKWTLLSSQKEI